MGREKFLSPIVQILGRPFSIVQIYRLFPYFVAVFLCHAEGKFLGLLPCSGFGGKTIGLDLAYQVLLYETRDINNNQQPLLNGKWDNTIHVGALSLKMQF